MSALPDIFAGWPTEEDGILADQIMDDVQVGIPLGGLPDFPGPVATAAVIESFSNVEAVDACFAIATDGDMLLVVHRADDGHWRDAGLEPYETRDGALRAISFLTKGTNV